MDPPHQYHGRDAMNNSTQHMTDEPTLGNGPPQYQSRDDLHTALAFTISEIPYSIFSKHIFA